MYCGHIGIALGVKAHKKGLPMWLLLLATQGCDWVETLFLATRLTTETSLWSHSVPSVAAGTLFVCAVTWVVTHSRSATGWIAAIYISHILLDYITGLKPLWYGSRYLGLRLYRQPILDFLLESVVIILGWVLYRRSQPVSARRDVLLWLLPLYLMVVQAMNDLLMGWLQTGEGT